MNDWKKFADDVMNDRPRPDGFWNPKVNLHPIPHDHKKERRAGWFLVILGAALLLAMVAGG